MGKVRDQISAINFVCSRERFCLLSPDASSGDPFLRDLAHAIDHPMVRCRKDILDGEHALIWLTKEEIIGGPKPPHPDTHRPGEHASYDTTIDAWENPLEPGRIWLLPREDHNVGLVPRQMRNEGPIAEDGYISPFAEKYQLLPWAENLRLMSHLGGTPFPVNDLPAGLTPWYLKLEEIGELNYGGGNAQINLESLTFDWSC